MTYTTETSGVARPDEPTVPVAILYRSRKPTRNRVRSEGRGLVECETHCAARNYAVERVFCDDQGSLWELQRRTLDALRRWLIMDQPDIRVLVIRDWGQVGKRPEDRRIFAESLALLGVTVEPVHPGGEPDVTWDTTDYTPKRATRRRNKRLTQRKVA